MPSGPFALLAAPQYPKPEPALVADVGWLILACVAAVLVWALCRAESVRRGVLGRTDPRVYAVLRVGFALMTIQCFWNLEPYWRMLWSDEGLFLADQARERLGRAELSGWTEVDGFLGWWGVARFLWGKQSLLYLHSEPDFVRAYLWTFFVLLGSYAVGFRSRITGLLCWLMMMGIYNRNALYIEGTDTVYKVFWLLLILSPTGHAWSLDNAFRVWRERRRRRRGGTGLDGWRLADRLLHLAWLVGWARVCLHLIEMPARPLWLGAGLVAAGLTVQAWVEGLAAAEPVDPAEPVVVHRRVANWPRVLMWFQLAAVYTTTGLVKTGSIWARGDALYYALNMDHFYRFEGITQQVSAWTSLNLLRIATWITHWWEICFPVVLLGVILRFAHEHRDEPWYRAQQAVRWRVWTGRVALVVGYLLLYRICIVAFPWCLAKSGGEAADPTRGLLVMHVVFAGVIPLAVGAWYGLGFRPLTLLPAGKRLGRLPLPGVRIEQESVRAWLLGRRVWLGLGFCFHGFLILFMNIGMFPFIMLMTYAAFIEGEVWARWLKAALGWARSRTWSRRLAPPAMDALVSPAAPSAQVHNDAPWFLDAYRVLVGGWTLLGVLVRRRPRADFARFAARARARDGRVPDLVVVGLAGLGIGLVILRGQGYVWNEEVEQRWLKQAIWAWVGLTLAAGALASLRGRGPRDAPSMIGHGPALAAGSLPRTAALVFCGWHCVCITMQLFPSYPVFDQWRSVARRPFTDYVRATALTQSWRMFAPNPPRSNTFMQTVILEQDGDRWDMRNNAYDERPFPWIINDRMRKMQRRMVGKGKWYLRYWAAYHCREWTLKTGEMPLEVRVNQFKTIIPAPEKVWYEGPYQPRELPVEHKHVQTHECERKGELPLYMKARHGIPLTAEDEAQRLKDTDRAAKRALARKRAWARRKDFGGPSPSEE